MINKLELRNLNGHYVQTNRSDRKQVYYNKEKNNVIVFTPCDPDVDVDQICNGIRTSAYFYLVSVLNTNSNIIVSWSAVSGTTSDYTIYYDTDVDKINLKSYRDVMNFLAGITDEQIGMKYTEVHDRKMTAIQNI